jgi:hypothetical protein
MALTVLMKKKVRCQRIAGGQEEEADAVGALTTRMTESPRRNILLMKRSLC